MVVAIPLSILGGICLILSTPPFKPENLGDWGIVSDMLMGWYNWAQANKAVLQLPYNMSMALMGLFIAFAIAYNLAKKYNLPELNASVISTVVFLIMAAPIENNRDVTLIMGENHLLMRQIRHMLSGDRMFFMHGAVVGLDDFGVLISGLSGAGKSTLAAWCAHYGMGFVGDDRIVVCMQNGVPVANPVYTTVSMSEKIPDFPAYVVSTNVDRAKDIYVFNSDFKFCRNMPIRAILEPTRGNFLDAGIIPAEKSGILSKIVMDYSNMGCLVNSPNPINDWRDISNLFQNVDFYRLNLGDCIADNAMKICDFIKQKGKICI
jgi:hypothetical protein